MIERKTGCLTLSKTVQIKPGDEINKIVALQLGEVQAVSDKQTGWQWLTIKNLRVDETYYILSFGFQANALKQIELIVSKDRFDLTAGWETWSKANELAILTDLRIWVTTELGREGNFGWGDVWAAYDPKSGTSSITLRYN